MKFAFIAKHRGSGRRDGCAGALGVSRGGFYAWLTQPAVSAAGAMKSLAPRFTPASLRAIEPMAPGEYGTTCWRRVCRVACIGSSD